MHRNLLLVSLAVVGLGPAVAADFTIDLGRGPVQVEEPAGYDPTQPAPLVILLHGYGGDGQDQEDYLRFGPLVDELGFFYLYPDGTVDQDGGRFWNATDACCDFYFTEVDDSGYVRALIDEVKTRRNIDADRVYVVGHSNGGFMTHRLACDHADAIAAVANLAGSTYLDPTFCQPSEPVHSLRIHGTRDFVIRYGGGYIKDELGKPFGFYPGAVESSLDWALRFGCGRVADQSAPPLDLDLAVAGEETHITRVEQGCDPGASVELWQMRRSFHTPFFNSQFARSVIEYFYANPKR